MNSNIELICYMEGVKIPIRALTMKSDVSYFPTAMISIVSTPLARFIKVGTIIQLFIKVNDDTPQLLFDGELVGKSYSRSRGKTNVGLSARDFRAKLEDVPSASIMNMGSPASGSTLFTSVTEVIEGAFLGYTAGEITTESIRSNSKLNYDFKTDGSNLYKYLSKFFSTSIGSDIVGVMKTKGRNDLNLLALGETTQRYVIDTNRLRIEDDHLIIGSGVYEEYAKSTFLEKFISNAHSRLSKSTGASLKVLNKSLNHIGLSYFTIPNPSKPISDNASLKTMNNHGKLEAGEVTTWKLSDKHSNVHKYIISPKFINMLPPTCNVIKADSSSSYSVSINDLAPTRVLDYYNVSSIVNSFPSFVTYPQESVEYTADNGGWNEAFQMTEEEKLTGIRGIIDKSESLLGNMAYQLNKTTETDQSGVYKSSYEKISRFKLLNLINARNKLNITLPYYEPSFVAGLPGLLTDEGIDVAYYGRIETITISANQESGGVSTTVEMSNIREVETLSEISKDDSSPSKSISSPFIDITDTKLSGVYNVIAGCGAVKINSLPNEDRAATTEFVSRNIITADTYFDIWLKGSEILQEGVMSSKVGHQFYSKIGNLIGTDSPSKAIDKVRTDTSRSAYIEERLDKIIDYVNSLPEIGGTV